MIALPNKNTTYPILIGNKKEYNYGNRKRNSKIS